MIIRSCNRAKQSDNLWTVLHEQVLKGNDKKPGPIKRKLCAFACAVNNYWCVVCADEGVVNALIPIRHLSEGSLKQSIEHCGDFYFPIRFTLSCFGTGRCRVLFIFQLQQFEQEQDPSTRALVVEPFKVNKWHRSLVVQNDTRLTISDHRRMPIFVLVFCF